MGGCAVGSVMLRGDAEEPPAGYGYGYGYGDGNGYWRAVLVSVAAQWPAPQRARLAVVQAQGSRVAFWRSDADGKPSNGGSKLLTPAAPGVVHRADGPLALCRPGTLHATLDPPRWAGARLWVVALHGEVIGNEEKYGCLERELLGEVRLG